ncbi:MAG: hypothetical protein P1V97_24350, partial [Planctomycetota bacterium]|nr:hypothetical protein [Planctomycetota bacterium]
PTATRKTRRGKPCVCPGFIVCPGNGTQSIAIHITHSPQQREKPVGANPVFALDLLFARGMEPNP